MPGALETIREYVISLGYKVDVASQSTAERSLSELEKTVSGFSQHALRDFSLAGVGVGSFVAATSKALESLTLGVANTDLQTQLFARSMWMSTDAARAYQASLSALGTNLQSIYMSPELMSKFVSMRNQAGEMALPADFEQTEQGVRNVTFELQRLKLEGQYGVNWIGYYLAHDLAGPMGNVEDMLKNLNDYLTKNMPQWTKNTADFLAQFAGLAQSMVSFGRDMIDTWDHLDTSTQNWIKTIGGAGAALIAFSNPITGTLAAMSALLLLIDDYEHYKTYGAGHSALPALWKEMDDLGSTWNTNPLKKNFDDLGTSVNSLGDSLTKLLAQVNAPLAGKNIFADMISGATDLTNTLAMLANVMGDLMRGDFAKAGEDFSAWQNVGELKSMGAGALPGYSPLLGAGAQGANTGPKDIFGRPMPAWAQQQEKDKEQNSVNLLYGLQDWLANAFHLPMPGLNYFPSGTNPAQPQSYLLPAPGATSRSVVVQYAPVHNFNNVSSPQEAAAAVHQQNVNDAAILTRMLQGVLT